MTSWFVRVLLHGQSLRLRFYDYLYCTTKYARWIQDSVAMFQCFSKEIENSRFLFSMYAFYENTHYTKKNQKVPF